MVLKKDRILRFAILGISGMAETYASLLRGMPNAQLITAWGRNPERTQAFAHKHGIAKPCLHLEEVLNNPDVDALLILTEPARHAALAIQGMAFGKHLLIEKPLDSDPQAARELVTKARGSGLTLGIISQFRFNPLLQEMKTALAQLDPESPKSVKLSLLWNRNEAYYQKGSGWRRQGSAVLINQGIHWLDVMNWFFGQPIQVQAVSRKTRPFLECPDFSSVLITYPDMVTVLMEAGTFCDRRYPDQLTIHHTKGCLDYATLLGPPPPTGFRERLGRWILQQPRWPRVIPNLLLLQLTDFITAIQENRPPRVTLEDGLRALELAVAASVMGE
ncbi:MAG: Gfo/Idh/MocA family oxidoreductase [Magnetococcales bacterium]|nr:Gfo/Idh/MocA family oxidoreductase [Magnetococcales bacterium]